MKTIAIEGLDGSGKTTTAHALAEHYESQHLSAKVVAPHRLASERHGSDIYELWHHKVTALHAIDLLKHVIETETVQAEHEGHDLLIFDRHWMTAFAEIGHDPELVAAWGDTFVPTVFLRIPPEEALARSDNDHYAPWMTPGALHDYAEKYESLAHHYGEHIMGIYRNDEDVTMDMLVHSIDWDMHIRR